MEQPQSSLAIAAFPDPRTFPDGGGSREVASWYGVARRSLEAETSDAARHDAELAELLAAALDREPQAVDAAIEHAPSPALARKLWRTLNGLVTAARGGEPLDVTLFALPLVIIAGVREGPAAVAVPGVLRDTALVAEALRTQRLLGGNETFAISAGLVPASVLATETLPRWQTLRRIGASFDPALTLLAPAALRVPPGPETVHLRFLIGSAVASTSLDILANPGAPGAALTRALLEQLAVAGVSLLPLPRQPQSIMRARHDGLVAQREVSAQIFASNAIRNLRASTGEPTAVISAHRAADAPGGGELRLSLSSPFDPRDAEGFRCPIYPIEAVTTPLRMLTELLRDCRVHDVRYVAGVHEDRAAGTGPLLFQPDTVPEGMLLQ